MALSAELGLRLRGKILSRGNHSVTLETELCPPTSLGERQALFFDLLGIRLGLDRLNTVYTFDDERPSRKEHIRNVYDQPSLYGDRLQFLLPRRALECARRVSGVEFVHKPWVDEQFAVVCLREVGKEWHLFAEADFDRVSFDRENLYENARLSLFYQSYKPKPQVESHAWGLLKTFRRSHGIITASRALLFPDYDYDAAVAGGILTVPSRKCFVVAEPNPGHFDEALSACVAHSKLIADLAPMPFSSSWYRLTRTSVEVGGAWEPSVLPHPLRVREQGAHV